ncbi:Z-ring formation inhibitor MciZ [Bacillus timonensis]|nr:Z-ring formation inhibitor MciZ [Bacillus timonensis]
MKVYLVPKGIILVGKAWEVREKLKAYSKQHSTLKQLIEHQEKSERNNLNK